MPNRSSVNLEKGENTHWTRHFIDHARHIEVPAARQCFLFNLRRVKDPRRVNAPCKPWVYRLKGMFSLNPPEFAHITYTKVDKIPMTEKMADRKNIYRIVFELLSRTQAAGSWSTHHLWGGPGFALANAL